MYDCRRMQSVQSPIIPVVGELIRSNPGTISLGQGVAYYGPPVEAFEYIQKFLADAENHKYRLVQGIPELLEAIEDKLERENGICIDEDSRIVVTAGGNMGFVNAVLAITDPGDEIILLLPYYFNHEMAVVIADCKAVCVPTDENYQLQPDLIRAAITDRTRAVVTISPNNPTGAFTISAMKRMSISLTTAPGTFHPPQ
jgi:aspartate/methionine/tyrosine aminotransferase